MYKKGVLKLSVINKIISGLKQKKYTQVDLAEHLKRHGVTKQTITDWKSGKSNSYYPLIGEIADFLGVTTDYLIKNSENTLEKKKENVQMVERRFANLENKLKLKAIRREQGLNNEQMAEAIGIGAEVYDEFESNSQVWTHTMGGSEKAKAKIMEYYNDVDFTQHNNKTLNEDEYKKTDLAKDIRRKRKLMNDTQKELADDIEVDLISVISWESGERTPKDRCLEEINKYLRFGESNSIYSPFNEKDEAANN